MPAATAARRSPCHALAAKAGATFSVSNGWELPASYPSEGEALERAMSAAVLIDDSSWSKLVVEGPSAAAFIADRLLLPVSEKVGGATLAGEVWAYRLRPDRALVCAPAGPGQDALRRLSEGDWPQLVSVTDMTDGWARLLLIGPQSKTVLARLTGLDIRDSVFPSPGSRQTSVAKTTQLILRHDLVSDVADAATPSYALLGGRSYAAYLWDALLDTGTSIDLRPAGLETLRRFRMAK